MSSATYQKKAAAGRKPRSNAVERVAEPSALSGPLQHKGAQSPGDRFCGLRKSLFLRVRRDLLPLPFPGRRTVDTERLSLTSRGKRHRLAKHLAPRRMFREFVETLNEMHDGGAETNLCWALTPTLGPRERKRALKLREDSVDASLLRRIFDLVIELGNVIQQEAMLTIAKKSLGDARVLWSTLRQR